MRRVRHVILLLQVILLTGCASRAWLFRWEAPNQDQVGSYLLTENPEGTQNYTIGFIEFDEQGDIKRSGPGGQDVDPFDRILTDLRRTARTRKVLLVTYIHGWQNSTRSGDVNHFRQFLKGLADTQRLADYRVYGIYCAWRGDVLPVSLARVRGNFLFSLVTLPSFWPREAAARRVGGPACTDALLRLAAASREQPSSKVIFVGHSFGALVLEQAMAQATLSRLISSNVERDPIHLPADLVVLLNQASPSLTAKILIDSFNQSKNERTYTSTKPLFVSITSKADSATGVAYPIARIPATAWASGRKYDVDPRKGVEKKVQQEYFLRRTPGHAEWLRSHKITEADSTVADPHPFSNAIEANLDRPVVSQSGEWFFQGELGRHWTLSRVHENKGLPPYNVGPYWIVQAPGEFIANHGDVWNSNVQGLIAAIIARNQM